MRPPLKARDIECCIGFDGRRPMRRGCGRRPGSSCRRSGRACPSPSRSARVGGVGEPAPARRHLTPLVLTGGWNRRTPARRPSQEGDGRAGPSSRPGCRSTRPRSGRQAAAHRGHRAADRRAAGPRRGRTARSGPPSRVRGTRRPGRSGCRHGRRRCGSPSPSRSPSATDAPTAEIQAAIGRRLGWTFRSDRDGVSARDGRGVRAKRNGAASRSRCREVNSGGRASA